MEFNLTFEGNYLKVGQKISLLDSKNHYKYLEVIDRNKIEWWKHLFKFITLGFYRIKCTYRVKIIENDKILWK